MEKNQKKKIPLELKSVNDIDTDRHGVIEASAGAGKTYTIENLILRMIKQGCPLQAILVVTFTEKAAGELLERIRSKIESELESFEEDNAILSEALNQFDRAQIFTIHGFCQRILNEYAFENNLQFEHELVDDAEIYEKVLKKIMREDWPERYGENLSDLLWFSGFGDNPEKWMQTVIRVAQDWKSELGERMIPHPDTDFSYEALGLKLIGALEALDRIIGDIPSGEFCEHPFYAGYGELNFNKRSRSCRQRDYLDPVFQLLTDYKTLMASTPEDRKAWAILNRIRDFLVQIDALKDSEGLCFQSLIPGKWNKGGDNSMTVCPDLGRFVDGLCELRRIYGNAQLQLSVSTIVQVKKDVMDYKSNRGLISFDDMLSLLYGALSPDADAEAANLRQTLQDRYRFGLVDEFQDTDMIQWHIFKTIFVNNSDITGNRLFIIGDPKQAIYGFRGADVHAYLKAKTEMIADFNAELYYLPFNWRSMPDLIDTYNPIFRNENWFSDHGDIAYIDIGYPADEIRRAQLFEDRSGRQAVTMVEQEIAADKASIARKKMAEFIAAESEKLLFDHPLIFKDKQRIRRLTAGDICILVRKAKESIIIEKALRDRNIPCTFYKKPGLFDSEEAAQLSCLLNALANPSDNTAFFKALLTRFFNIPKENIAHYENLPPEHPIKNLFLEWRELCTKRKWGRLFAAFYEQTGLIYREMTEPDAERRHTNYEQLTQHLEIIAYTRNFDIVELSDHFDKLRRKIIKPDEDSDIHRIETEKPKVQIMTIHASKGLEFPVVFLAGGFTNTPGRDGFYKLHDAEGNVFYDLSLSEKDRFKHEQEEEEKRLYYVAITRAIYKLYLPFFPRPKGPRNSPITGFIYQSLAEVRDAFEFPLPVIDSPATTDNISPEETETANNFIIPDPLLPKTESAFRNRVVLVDSFSGIVSRPASREQPSLIPEPHEILDETVIEKTDDDTAKDSDTALENIEHRLPPGARTGDFIHAVFENIDFQTVYHARDFSELIRAGAETLDTLRYWLNIYHIAEDAGKEEIYIREAARILWNTLHTPLNPHGLSLGRLEAGDRIHELEFYYPLPDTSMGGIPEITTEKNGYLKGFIDLIFRWQNHIYIADWKSNYLENGYGEEAIRHSMDHHNYHLQYKVYAVALRRWLKTMPHPPEFGGIYYFFVRGMDGVSADNGIFFYKPENDAEIRSYEHEIQTLRDSSQYR